MWWWGDAGHMGGWGGWAFFSHMLLWWVFVVLGIVVLARWLLAGSDRRRPPAEDRALAILKERYARGEINREDFEQRKSDLSG